VSLTDYNKESILCTPGIQYKITIQLSVRCSCFNICYSPPWCTSFTSPDTKTAKLNHPLTIPELLNTMNATTKANKMLTEPFAYYNPILPSSYPHIKYPIIFESNLYNQVSGMQPPSPTMINTSERNSNGLQQNPT